MPEPYIKDPDAKLDYTYGWANWLDGYSCLTDAATDTFKAPSHGLQNGMPVAVGLHDIARDTMPLGFSRNTTYYVVEATGNTFKLATSANGIPLDVGSDKSVRVCYERIDASTWTVTTGITMETTAPRAPSNTLTDTTVWLSGGTVAGGEEIGNVRGIAQRAYRVTNRITTSAGRTDDRSIFVAVAER